MLPDPNSWEVKPIKSTTAKHLRRSEAGEEIAVLPPGYLRASCLENDPGHDLYREMVARAPSGTFSDTWWIDIDGIRLQRVVTFDAEQEFVVCNTDPNKADLITQSVLRTTFLGPVGIVHLPTGKHMRSVGQILAQES